MRSVPSATSDSKRANEAEPSVKVKTKSVLTRGSRSLKETKALYRQLRDENLQRSPEDRARTLSYLGHVPPLNKEESWRFDKVQNANLKRLDTTRLQAAMAASDAELILHTEECGVIQPETDMEKTFKLTQQQMKRDYLGEEAARQIYDISLNQSYGMTYDRSGRFGILFGKHDGHVSRMDMHSLSLSTEFFLKERVRDATFLHNATMFALAQQKHVYIYDDKGVEIHQMQDHQDVSQLQFLPHHWLMGSVGRAGYLKYHDTSTGTLVSTHRTKLGPCSHMRQNPQTAILHLGHLNGTVTLWSPASATYLVKMQCHRGASVQSLAIDLSGRYMVTGGAESQVKIWDLRMYKETHSYYTVGGPPTSLDISQRGIVGVGHGCHGTFWSANSLKTKERDPYMGHIMPGCGPVETLRFRPFEDVCGIGHQKGFSSIVIPGSGEANLDSTEYNTNPYQDSKQRREAEVRSLLDKLSPDMIALNPHIIGSIELDGGDAHQKVPWNEEKEEKKEGNTPRTEKNRMKGRNKTVKKLKRKAKNVIDENLIKLKEKKEKERTKKRSGGDENTAKDEAPTALKRFFK